MDSQRTLKYLNPAADEGRRSRARGEKHQIPVGVFNVHDPTPRYFFVFFSQQTAPSYLEKKGKKEKKRQAKQARPRK